MTQRVAILGLGTMGAGMAHNLSKSGFPVTVFNRTRVKAELLAVSGACMADTARDAAREADIVISMLSDNEAPRQTWTGDHGALSGAKPGTVLIESSTVTPTWIEELAQLAAKHSLYLLDAPVTGSKAQAAGGQLNFLVGGDASVLEQVRPVLAAMSKQLVLLGPIGSGARMKLINNFLAASRSHRWLKGWCGLSLAAASIATKP